MGGVPCSELCGPDSIRACLRKTNQGAFVLPPTYGCDPLRRFEEGKKQDSGQPAQKPAEPTSELWVRTHQKGEQKSK